MTVDLALPPNFSASFDDLVQRVRVLESRNALLQSSIKGGGLSILDSTGAVQAVLGVIGSIGNGIVLANGALLVTDSGGVVFPYLANPWRRTSDSVTVTSGTFVTTHECRTEVINSVAVRFTVAVNVDAATTAEIRVQAAGATLGSVQAAGASTAAWYEFSLVHGLALGSGPVVFSLQARRVSGAGNVTVFEPTGLTFGATAAYGGAFPVVSGGWHAM